MKLGRAVAIILISLITCQSGSAQFFGFLKKRNKTNIPLKKRKVHSDKQDNHIYSSHRSKHLNKERKAAVAGGATFSKRPAAKAPDYGAQIELSTTRFKGDRLSTTFNRYDPRWRFMFGVAAGYKQMPTTTQNYDLNVFQRTTLETKPGEDIPAIASSYFEQSKFNIKSESDFKTTFIQPMIGIRKDISREARFSLKLQVPISAHEAKLKMTATETQLQAPAVENISVEDSRKLPIIQPTYPASVQNQRYEAHQKLKYVTVGADLSATLSFRVAKNLEMFGTLGLQTQFPVGDAKFETSGQKAPITDNTLNDLIKLGILKKSQNADYELANRNPALPSVPCSGTPCDEYIRKISTLTKLPEGKITDNLSTDLSGGIIPSIQVGVRYTFWNYNSSDKRPAKIEKSTFKARTTQ